MRAALAAGRAVFAVDVARLAVWRQVAGCIAVQGLAWVGQQAGNARAWQLGSGAGDWAGGRIWRGHRGRGWVFCGWLWLHHWLSAAPDASGGLIRFLPCVHNARLAKPHDRLQRRVLGIQLARGHARADEFTRELASRINRKGRHVARNLLGTLLRRLIGCIAGQVRGECVGLGGRFHGGFIGGIDAHIGQGAVRGFTQRAIEQLAGDTHGQAVNRGDDRALGRALLQQASAVLVQVGAHRINVARVNTGFLNIAQRHVARFLRGVTNRATENAAANTADRAANRPACPGTRDSAHATGRRADDSTDTSTNRRADGTPCDMANAHASHWRHHVAGLFSQYFADGSRIVPGGFQLATQAAGLAPVLGNFPAYRTEAARYAIARLPRLHQFLAFLTARVGRVVVAGGLDALGGGLVVANGHVRRDSHGVTGLVPAALESAVRLGLQVIEQPGARLLSATN